MEKMQNAVVIRMLRCAVILHEIESKRTNKRELTNVSLSGSDFRTQCSEGFYGGLATARNFIQMCERSATLSRPHSGAATGASRY